MNNGTTATAETSAQTNSAAMPEKPQGFGPVAGVSKDRDGRVFDAAKFLPEKDTNGRWKRIGGPGKPGRPKGSKSTPKPAESKATAPELPRADFSDIDAAARAETPATADGEQPASAVVLLPENATAEGIIGILQTALVLIGDEEGVLTDAEKILLRPPLERVLAKYNVGKDVLPAEADLALAVAGLVIARMQKPKTATFFAKCKAWVVNQWFSGKGRALARDIREHVASVSPSP